MASRDSIIFLLLPGAIMTGRMRLPALLISAGLLAAAAGPAQADCRGSYMSHWASGAIHKALAMTVSGAALANPQYPTGYACG